MTKYTFKKTERLTGKTTIDQLFSSGESFFYYPFRVAFHVLPVAEQLVPCRVLINVPKRLHKTAVARNLLKRRIKEAYRLTKEDLYTQLEDERIHLALLYSSKEVLDQDTIQVKWDEVQKRLLTALKTAKNRPNNCG